MKKIILFIILILALGIGYKRYNVHNQYKSNSCVSSMESMLKTKENQIKKMTKSGINNRDERGKNALMLVLDSNPRYCPNKEQVAKKSFYLKANNIILNLLNKGININARDNDGWTALMYATLACWPVTTISLLIDAGADVNARNSDGKTALQEAEMFCSNDAIIGLLVGAGARY